MRWLRLFLLLERSDGSAESNGESEEVEEKQDDTDDDADALLQRLSAIAAARVIPLEWLILQAHGHDSGGDDDSDDELVEYSFDSLPTSLDDVAKFILSDKCKSIIVLAGAGMSVASWIPDFRSADSFYATLNADLLTADGAEKNPTRRKPLLEHNCSTLLTLLDRKTTHIDAATTASCANSSAFISAISKRAKAIAGLVPPGTPLGTTLHVSVTDARVSAKYRLSGTCK